ncbi:MAG: mRNA surveillance protein pelota [Candidatus Marsarchaeota archaeon]|nr:mRNA surveillance protein pelota [Candidatus Marsarchaeota archaeon]
MRIMRFNRVSNAIKLEPESFDDLYLLAMIIAPGDRVEGRGYRRFRASEGDVGEQKEVFIEVSVEKVEIDKSAGRLRLIGTILQGRPAEYVSMGGHHTINVAEGDIIDVMKPEWKEYILKRLKQAQAEARKPKLGIIVMDDEKALVSYIRGYGIDIVAELYSHLSKRMKEKDYGKQRVQYFNDIIKSAENMSVDIIIIAGPGFTKDDLRKHISDMNIETKKRLVYAAASDAERSGIREVMRSGTVGELLQNEHVKKEFEYLNVFLAQLRAGQAASGAEGVAKAIAEARPQRILVNDSAINEPAIKRVLDLADSKGIRIEIYNADDDAGMQLRSFRDIAAI